MRAARRIERAISFGVFCRFAPSTSEIMRSRKVSPGLAVMRTISQSESTWVPPVTELRSPPLSRITGALSPVTAASLTDAAPAITSPSPGMVSPASTRTTSPLRRSGEGISVRGDSKRGSWSFLAIVVRRVWRRAAAWALPRPSAIASAKLANSTVNQSQTATARMNPAGASPLPTSACTNSPVVRMLPM